MPCPRSKDPQLLTHARTLIHLPPYTQELLELNLVPGGLGWQHAHDPRVGQEGQRHAGGVGAGQVW